MEHGFICLNRWGEFDGYAMQAVDTVSEATVKPFLSFHLKSGQIVRTYALPALNAVAREHLHEKKITPPEKASEWLPLVHIMIGNMKKFLNGTFHGCRPDIFKNI